MGAPNITITTPVDGLVSYHYYRSPETMQGMIDNPRLRLIADSGAFSAFTQGATISLAEYATWLTTYRHGLHWAAALDVFGDPTATYRNWATLRDDHGLDTVPTLHIGANPELLATYAKQGVDFVALGGLVGVAVPTAFRWLVHMLRHARRHHPHMRFHAWGQSTHSTLSRIPLYSVDSSGLTTRAYRYGRLLLFQPRKRTVVEINLNGHEPLKYQRLLADSYGVNAQDVLKSHTGNRDLLNRLALRSAQLRAQHMQRLHKIPPPVWAINPRTPHLPGTRMHAVMDRHDYSRLWEPLAVEAAS